MLSYRHAFHAGNHADVLKHFVLQQVLLYTKQKEKPFWYIDTHAGAGMYQLDAGYASKNAEYAQGIRPLLNAANLPTSLQAFVQCINTLDAHTAQHGTGSFYPGSPAIAEACMRADDKMRLFELHPTDFAHLTAHFANQKRQVKVAREDGFNGLKSLLPPATRRAVVLIDPPYEDKQDYEKVVSVCQKALSIFATGTYLVWYPLLQRPEPLAMVDALQALPHQNWLNVSLTVQAPAADGFGMYGSGVFVINPPWTLPATLEEALPVVVSLLAQDATAHFTLEQHLQ